MADRPVPANRVSEDARLDYAPRPRALLCADSTPAPRRLHAGSMPAPRRPGTRPVSVRTNAKGNPIPLTEDDLHEILAGAAERTVAT